MKAPQREVEYEFKVISPISLCDFIPCFVDTKGQQFFDERESSYADAIVKGTLEDGSAVENQHTRYWITIGSIGFFETSSLETCPHVILLVFDASLKSLQKVLNVDFSNPEWENQAPQLACYHRVLDRAEERRLDVFVCLTHIDILEKQMGGVTEEQNATERRVGEPVQEQLDELVDKLARR